VNDLLTRSGLRKVRTEGKVRRSHIMANHGFRKFFETNAFKAGMDNMYPESEQSFSRKLTDMGFENKQLQRNRKRDYYWIGVKIVDSKKVEDEGQQTFEDLTDEQLEKLKWK
jgi:hypothetical protein